MKSTLFRFGTYRNHQLISESKKKKYYIQASTTITSKIHYLPKSIRLKKNWGKTYQQVIDIMKRKEASFKSTGKRKSLNELRSLDITIYEASLLLIKSKTRFNFDDTNQFRDSFKTIRGYVLSISFTKYSTDHLIELWDNLFDALFIVRDKPKVDGIISLLAANYFLDKFKTGTSPDKYSRENAYDYYRYLNAKVIIPVHIQKVSYAPITENLMSSESKKELLSKHNAVIANCEVNELKLIRDEIKLVNMNLKAENKLAFAAEVKKQNKQLEDARKNLGVVNVKSLKSVSNVKFEPKILNREEIIKKVEKNNPTIKFVNFQLGSRPIQNVSATNILNELDKKIKSQLIKFSKPRFYTQNILSFNGFVISVPLVIEDNSFVIDVRRNLKEESVTRGKAKLYDLFLTQYYDDEETAVVEISGTLKFGTKGTTDQPLVGEKCTSLYKKYVTFKLNTKPFQIPSSVDKDVICLRYRNSINLLEDIVHDDIEIRLNYPHYGIMKTEVTSIQFPEKTPLYGVTNLGINDFRRVDQEICCYVKGEVSHIENIMAAEYKEKTTRSLISTEISTEDTSVIERENSKDTTTTERFEMQAEISTVLSEEKSKNLALSAGVSGSYPGSEITFTADGSADWSSSSSFEESTNEAITQAKEITEQVKERILSKVTKKRTYKMKKEYEEINKHGFDNRGNKNHVVGIYRWIDKLYDNYLVNYGRRLMYEFMIPQPGKNFLESIVIKAEKQIPTGQVKIVKLPIHPNEVEEEDFNVDSINEDNYTKYAAAYLAEVEKPPREEIRVSKAYASEVRDHGDTWKTDTARAFNDLEVPEGYTCSEVLCKGDSEIHGTEDADSEYKLTIGTTNVRVSDDDITDDIEETEGTIPISYRTRDIGTLSFNVTAICKRKDELYSKWQIDTYNAILKAYEERLQAYNDEIMQDQEVIPEDSRRDINYNPQINRTIEKNELKRLCIEMITVPFKINVSKGHYKKDRLFSRIIKSSINQATRLNLTPELDTHSQQVDFLEQAFDWDIMAYKFLPYFYAARKDWFTVMHESGTNDELFKAFLTAGMAKVKLPVRRGYENAVQFFLETGEIWKGGGFVLDVEDDQHVSINEEIDTGNEEIKIEKQWQTQIPTSLTIVQSDGSSLNDQGLPCSCEHEESELKKIAYETLKDGRTATLTGKKDSTDSSNTTGS